MSWVRCLFLQPILWILGDLRVVTGYHSATEPEVTFSTATGIRKGGARILRPLLSQLQVVCISWFGLCIVLYVAFWMMLGLYTNNPCACGVLLQDENYIKDVKIFAITNQKSSSLL